MINSTYQIWILLCSPVSEALYKTWRYSPPVSLHVTFFSHAGWRSVRFRVCGDHGISRVLAHVKYTVQNKRTNKTFPQNYVNLSRLMLRKSYRKIVNLLALVQRREMKLYLRVHSVSYGKRSCRYAVWRLCTLCFVTVSVSFVSFYSRVCGAKCLHSSEGLSIQPKPQLLSGRTGEK